MPDELVAATTYGTDQPERFLTAWFGPPDRAVAEVPDEVPVPLIGWHRLAGRWDVPVLHQNRIPSETYSDGERLVVGIEAQGVWLWGIDGSAAVFERENVDGADWTPTGEHLDEFLWHFVLVDAVFGAETGAGANEVDAVAFQRLAATWTPIEAPSWRWPGPSQQLWVNGGVLAWSIGNEVPGAAGDPSTYALFVGARSVADLAVLDDLGIEWDWS